MARFRFLPDRSRVWIDARSNVHPVRSTSDGLEGFVDLSVDAEGRITANGSPEGRLSFKVARLSSGNRLEDRELQNRIGADKYPTIDGVLDRIEPAGKDGTFRVAGDVTFRGVVRRHEDQMTLSALDATTIKLEGASRFDVRDFDLEPPRMFMLKMYPEVDVRVEIIAVKEETHA